MIAEISSAVACMSIGLDVMGAVAMVDLGRKLVGLGARPFMNQPPDSQEYWPLAALGETVLRAAKSVWARPSVWHRRVGLVDDQPRAHAAG